MIDTFDVAANEEHILDVLCSTRFLRMEGLGNEVAFFIYPYPPELALEIDASRRRLINKVNHEGLTVKSIDLYDLSVRILVERGVWDRVLEVEASMEKEEFRELLQGMLDPGDHLAPAIQDELAGESFDMVFITGIGEVFPFIRSHNVLNNLQSVVTTAPLLMFFPGRYEQSPTLGSSLVLFGRLKDDQYYRAKNILDQEA